MGLHVETATDLERERVELLCVLSDDQGPDWHAGFRPGSFGGHELLDRTSPALDLIDRSIRSHPSCAANAEWFAPADQAVAALGELYQRVGAEQLAGETDGGAD